MAQLSTLPAVPWFKRLAVVLSGLLVVLGVAVMAGFLIETAASSGLRDPWAGLRVNAGLCLVTFGIVLLLIQFDLRRAAWGAAIPALLSALVLIEHASGRSLGIDGLFVQDPLAGTGVAAGRMPPLLAAGFFLSGISLISMVAGIPSRVRTPALALIGSTLFAVGSSTVLGHLLKLPTVYTWGTPPVTARLTGLALLGLGAAFMSLGWREANRRRPGAPSWLPLPVMMASATLTFVFALGLRGRESEFTGTTTEIQINGLASAINLELERQINAFDRLGRRWSESPDLTETVRDVDGGAQLSECPACLSLSLVSLDRQTIWQFPKRSPNGSLRPRIAHPLEPARMDAMDAVRRNLGAILSGTLLQSGLGPGFAIYAPVMRQGQLDGYVTGEYTYRRFFAGIEQRLKMAANYHCSIDIGGVRVFEAGGEASDLADTIEKVFTLHGRRIRIGLAPNAEHARLNRRFLPELALAAGFGITVLLGLSVHLARTSSTGLRAAETYNKRLIAENEERRRVEAMLKVSDERLRLAIESTDIGIFEWQQTGDRVFYSPGVWAILGYDPATHPLTLEVWAGLVHPDDQERYQSAWDRQLRGEVLFIDPEYRIRTADGSWRWIYVRSRGFSGPGPSRTPTRIVGTIQDISERKLAEQALRESQSTTRKLSLVASRTDNLVIIAKPDGTIEWVNESFARVMEYSLAEITGRHPEVFLSGPEADGRILRRVKSALDRGEGISTDLVNYSKSGRKYYVHLEIQPVRNEKGDLENFIAIETDITARVETENALRRAKLEADAASRAKSEFLASMSHEIRTPMNGVIGMTSLLLETPLNPEQRDYLATIRTSGEALLTIINDILDFSKIESGKMEIENQPVDLPTCIEEALDLFSLSAASKKLELAYCISEGVPDWIVSDITRLRQILANLINNAVKFTSSGSVSIEVQTIRPAPEAAAEPGALRLQFSVRDTGIGIPADRVDRLFKPFSQVDSSTTRKYGGTGLGLAICQRLSALMGGEIRVESESGRGSVFIFTIQTSAAPVPPESVLPPLPESFRGRPILCVEDHIVTQRRLIRLVRELGARPVPAHSVPDAVQLLARTDDPAAVILDLPMIEASEGRVLRDRITALQIPTVLLLPLGQTSVSAFGERRLFSTAAKPLKTQSLIRALRALGQSVPRKDAPPPVSAVENRLLAQDYPLDVLVVEDNPVNQKVALRFLERLGYRAITADNGVEALTALESREFDLVFMDLQMPEMDGFEASRQIRRRFAITRQPKIVALTANALQGDRELCLTAGMDDYITKPVKLTDIAAVIQKQFVKAAPQET
ncbi:MAG: ATP-binding protein [Opitutaceae bacterium]